MEVRAKVRVRAAHRVPYLGVRMRKTALVVDDSPSLRQMVAMTLKTAGFDVVEATDGEDALLKLKGRAIDLFVCDLHMPKLDGLEFTRRVRALPELSLIHI